MAGLLLTDYFRAPAPSEKPEAEKLSKEEEITRRAALLRRLLIHYPARDWQFSLDGQDFSGPYLLLETMNIRSVGPVLTLAPEADTPTARSISSPSVNLSARLWQISSMLA